MDAVGRIRDVVAHAVARWELRRIHIAFSGGPDSSVLADAAAASLGAAQVRLLHVHHGVAASDAASAHARAWAEARGFPLAVAEVAVPAGASWEAQARRARYRALAELAGDELIATGHTASDQAETVLLRLIRGTGPAGLAGILRRRGSVVRPLLEVFREEIDGYAAARELRPWRDPMNDELRYARVRVRREILPAMRVLNPGVEAALIRLAAAAAEEGAVLDAQATELVKEARRSSPPSALACGVLAAAPPPIAKRALARWLQPDISAEAVHLDGLIELVRAPTDGSRALDLPGGRVVRRYDHLDRAAPAEPGVELAVDGPDGPYRVRRWAPGDRMRPPRLRGRSRKLSDLYGDAKVPRELRAAARVVEDADGAIVWAEHLGPAIDAAITVRAVERDRDGADLPG